MENIDYLELAIKQFLDLKESALDDNRHCVGAESEETYTIGENSFILAIDGYWEKCDWFTYKANKITGEPIEVGTHCF